MHSISYSVFRPVRRYLTTIDSQRGTAIIISYPTNVSGIIVLLKSNEEISLDLADFALQEQLEDNLMIVISLAWCNVSYTMAAKPIKFLELLYTIIQFLRTLCRAAILLTGIFPL